MAARVNGTAILGGLAAILVLAAGASAQEAVPAPDLAPDPNAVPYISRHAVFRPAFNIPTRRPLLDTGYEYPTKGLFLRGYAGMNYGRGPREAFIPTGYGTGYIAPVGLGAPVPQPTGPCFGRRWLRRR